MTAAAYRALPKQRRHKYNAKRTVVDGLKFDSKGESRRWMELRLLERAGKIRNLRRQIPYELSVVNWRADTYHQIGKYVADFAYEQPTGKTIVEEFKGFKTAMGERNRRHVELEYGIKILLTGPAKRKRSA